MMQENQTTPMTRYVLKYNDNNKQGFLGYVLKEFLTADHSRPDFEPKANENNKIGSILLSDLQDKDIHLHIKKEKAETSKSVLMNQKNADQEYTISVVEIQIDPNTEERRVVKKM